MSNETNTPSQRSNTTLWLLLASFLVPAIAAYFYFFFGERPNSNNNGELISPVVDIETLKLTNQNGELLDRETLSPKWRMYYFVNQACNNECQATLFNMRQINIALGKNRNRVEHVIVHLEQAEDTFDQLIEAEHQKAIRLYGQLENISIHDNKNNQSLPEAIYLMDPLGNVMMKFPQQLSPKLILKDINKLLKISRIG